MKKDTSDSTPWIAEPGSLYEKSIEIHASPPAGKLAVRVTKPLRTKMHLSLAYSPGVAAPVRMIAQNESDAWRYTTKGNSVAVITNGTAILGLGNLGALAAKPVMEGKVALFKRFADIDGTDICVDTEDAQEFVNSIKCLGKTWGGINLEDIKAPECFVIEADLREAMDIPVFHDDQHGTAIIVVAGLINACDLTKRDISSLRIVINGAGAAGIACAELIKVLGAKPENVLLCDSRGVIQKGRTTGMNPWKQAHAVDTQLRTLEDAVSGADAFIGLSVKGAMTQDMVRSMANKPIIFALANPDPEITPEDAYAAVPDAIVATGRSDYPNQVNNVLGFPYIFRGALDVRATRINNEMKIAAVQALAHLAREDVPDAVEKAVGSTQTLTYGPSYLIPAAFDHRLISTVPIAVAKAAMESGVARKPIEDFEAYRQTLRRRLDPSGSSLERISASVKSAIRRVVFAEGEEEETIRAALAFKSEGYGHPILIAREDVALKGLEALGHGPGALEITNARLIGEECREHYINRLFDKHQRSGLLLRDCQRKVNHGRNSLAALMVANGDADAMVTGQTRPFKMSFEDIGYVFDSCPGQRPLGVSMMISGHSSSSETSTLFISDTIMTLNPSAEDLAQMTVQVAETVRGMGFEPRVALTSCASFGHNDAPVTEIPRRAVQLLDSMNVDFEYEGEMTPDIALNHERLMSLFPFARLSAPANILMMPSLNAAIIAARSLSTFGGATAIGPILTGLTHSVQIVPMGSSVEDILNAAIFAAHGVKSNAS